LNLWINWDLIVGHGSAVYLLVAKKRVVPLTPIKLQWRARRQMIATGVAGTTTGMNPHKSTGKDSVK